MANQFQVGDVVQLKSGGPEMTVTGTDGDMVYCSWFDRGKENNGHYPAGALNKVR